MFGLSLFRASRQSNISTSGKERFKYPLPRENKISQMPYPRDNKDNQIPTLCPAPPPSGFTLIGALLSRDLFPSFPARIGGELSMRQKSAFPWKNSNQILFGSFLLYDKRNEKLDALMFQPEAHMGSCSAQEPQCVLSLASENRTGACVCVRVWGKGYGLYGKVPPEKSGEVCATQ